MSWNFFTPIKELGSIDTDGNMEMTAIADLPVAEAIPRLLASLADHPNAVLVAPPGAGKTTTVPLVLLRQARWAVGRIVMLEPRR
jgi:ATP-dependent helicase HrpB